ncbi:YraN family protein, partial [Klebsiella oxytoca]
QRKLRAAAELYLMKYPTRMQPRFDVAEVYASQGVDTLNPVIRIWENAF